MSFALRRATTALATAAGICRGTVLNSAYVAGSRENLYTSSPMPEDFVLERVVVVHRHGDRSQIARSIGPNFPETTEVTEFWKTKLPDSSLLRAMASVAFSASPLPPDAIGASSSGVPEGEGMYYGEDARSFPYAQLTEVGARQLEAVGRQLRKRYLSPLTEGQQTPLSSLIYARSTNMCRTMQSLRSLLVGLLDPPKELDEAAAAALRSAIQIDTRPKSKEVLFPTADGPCDGLTQRRSVIFPPGYMEEKFAGFVDLERRVKEALGYNDKVSWLTVKEILTCRHVHGLPLPGSLSARDEEDISRLAGWMWGEMHADDRYNRLAIGRFIGELLSDLRGARQDKRLLIYSGHDSTLVPLLCALGCYDGVWPPYASFLALELVRNKSGERFVRAIYNDEPVAMASCGGGGDDVWCPLNAFLARLEAMSLSPSAYKDECQQGEISESDNKAVQLEIKATIG